MAGSDASNSLLGNRSGGASIDHPLNLMVSIEEPFSRRRRALSEFGIMVKPREARRH